MYAQNNCGLNTYTLNRSTHLIIIKPFIKTSACGQDCSSGRGDTCHCPAPLT
uniref:Uncharacterized protein n=1 Tax=Octopus bimaculoides TaxID=37653 RepID=A0A0L8FLY5_OCTBM